MPTYKWYGSLPREDVTTDAVMGYPWVAEDATLTEFAAKTADAILSEVGTDPVKAQAALEIESKRETPRVGLTRKLEKIANP